MIKTLSESENYAPREEFTDIRVDKSGRWFTGSKQIINAQVLKYFRANLQHDDKGVFIWNIFGKFREKGYIKVEGPVFSVSAILDKTFHLNNGQSYSHDSVQLVMTPQEEPLLAVKALGVWAGFPSRVANEFAEYLTEKEGQFFFKGQPVETREINSWVF